MCHWMKRGLGENGYTQLYGCSPETITTLVIGYSPIQNVFGIKKIKNKVKKLPLRNNNKNFKNGNNFGLALMWI